jgi:hypothetical protein
MKTNPTKKESNTFRMKTDPTKKESNTFRMKTNPTKKESTTSILLWKVEALVFIDGEIRCFC